LSLLKKNLYFSPQLIINFPSGPWKVIFGPPERTIPLLQLWLPVLLWAEMKMFLVALLEAEPMMVLGVLLRAVPTTFLVALLKAVLMMVLGVLLRAVRMTLLVEMLWAVLKVFLVLTMLADMVHGQVQQRPCSRMFRLSFVFLWTKAWR
jgi:hypothetical protein